MSIKVSAKGNFIPAPEGTWPGVCVDVVDKGIVTIGDYKPRHMVQFRWILDAEPPLADGKPHMAVRSFGLSLHEKSSLRPFLESWRGKKFTEDELQEFELEDLIGANGQIQILQTKRGGIVYGNVQAILPLGRGMAKMEVPSDYVRQVERDRRAGLEKEPDGAASDPFAEEGPGDDSIPF